MHVADSVAEAMGGAVSDVGLVGQKLRFGAWVAPDLLALDPKLRIRAGKTELGSMRLVPRPPSPREISPRDGWQHVIASWRAGVDAFRAAAGAAGGATLEFTLVAGDRSWPVEIGFARDELFVSYGNKKNFDRWVQAPHTRVKDPSLMAHHAGEFFRAHPNDHVLRAAALTVLLHRLKDGVDIPLPWNDELQAAILNTIETLIREPGDRMKYRWTMSLSLAAFYVHVIKNPGDLTEPRRLLSNAFAIRDHVHLAPPQATNTLKVTFYLGNLLHCLGEHGEAQRVLLSAKDTIRRAAAGWYFENYYSSNEFILAAQLVRICLRSAEEMHHATHGTWRDRSYASVSDRRDYGCLAAFGQRILEMMEQGSASAPALSSRTPSG